VSESVSYLDVGLKLEVEPTVFLDNEVAVKVNLEVSNVVREIKGRTGSLTYQVGTRLATTTLRLKDGETQALAGLISDEDRRSAAGVPGLLELPVLGRLFSSERSDRSKTEIVLLLTPRVVRNIDGPRAQRLALPSGTEAQVGAPTLRVQGPGRIAAAPGRGGAAATAGAGAMVEDDSEAEAEGASGAAVPPAPGASR
jgi:general secretion pathway protein D